MGKYTGIDVSKASLDISFCDEKGNWQWKQISNCLKGFRQLLKFSPIDNVIVMEASGPYYVQLATYLHSQGRKVCVVNPLQVRRYGQMRMYRTKTDRKDASTIAEFAQVNKPRVWKPEALEIKRMRQIVTMIEGIHKQMNIVDNQLEALNATGDVDAEVQRTLKSIGRLLKSKKSKLEDRLENLVKTQYGETVNLLMSIPGVGIRASTMLIITTNNFQKFNNYKQLIAYVGFSPRIFQSGTSVNGKGHICKMGKSQIRKILYMCTWTAKFCNDGCRKMYERLKAKGKPEKVIKIALANKLLKQAFAVVLQNQPYDKNYQPKTCF